MPERDIVPLSHVRGTLFVLEGTAYDGGDPWDFNANANYGLQFHVVDPDTWTTLLSTANVTVTKNIGGVTGAWKIVAAGDKTVPAMLPKDEYWYQVTALDEDGAPHPLVRGPLTLTPAPSGLGV